MTTHIEKAKPIKLLILDVDGVLTNGTITFGPSGHEVKDFHAHDGLGIKLFQQSGLTIAIISGHSSTAAALRFSELNIEHTYLGHNDKLPAYEELKQKLNLKDNEIAYMGDDLPDLPLLRRAGLAITVPQAPNVIKQHCDYVTTVLGGHGAVREVCEHILNAQGRFETVLQYYLT